MGTISLQIPVAGTEITAGLHAANYNALQTLLNGNLDTANLAANSVGTSELASGAVTNDEAGFTWTAWSPTKITQDAADTTNIAHTVNYGKYCKIGKLVFVQLYVSFTAGGTSGQQMMVHGLPVSVAGSQRSIGHGYFVDNTVDFNLFVVLNVSATQIRFVRDDEASYMSAPQIASGDDLTLNLVYESV